MEHLKHEFKQEIEKIEHYTPKLDNKQQILKDLELLLSDSIKKRFNNHTAILFSAGIDSSLLVILAKKLNLKFKLYTLGTKDSKDVIAAKALAKKFKIKIHIITENEVKKAIKQSVIILKNTNFTNVSLASLEIIAIGLAKKDKITNIITGLGAEEIFAGYQRHRNAKDLQKECWSGLKKLYEQDLEREHSLQNYFNIQTRAPFLDRSLIQYAMNIKEELKINDNIDKLILRQLAEKLGLPKEIAYRKKVAFQYGSNIDKLIERLAKKNKLKNKSHYINSFENLGVLYSSGKDSNYALYKMKQENYNIKCLITLNSKNPDSYMFHTATIGIAKLQAKALKIPLIEHSTKGEEELELLDLKTAIKKAKTKYKLTAIVTGALYSEYQSNRIKNICEELNLKCYSPLWHIDQEQELRELIKNKFEFILTKIAAEGLDKSWLGRIITEKDIDSLVKIKNINVAGEGGEYESLVLNCPLFKKKIVIKKSEIQEESKNTATLFIREAELL